MTKMVLMKNDLIKMRVKPALQGGEDVNVSTSTAESDANFEGFTRLEQPNVFAPGFYWRAKENIVIVEDRYGHEYRTSVADAGDVLLLLDIFEFEDTPHTVELQCHPCQGTNTTYKFLVPEFLEKWEPAHDAEEVRKQEQAEIMERVAAIQDQMAQAEVNPLALPDVQKAVEKAVSEFENEMEREVARSKKTADEKKKDLRRIHRRAARRSEAAGNPLVVQKVVVSNQLSDMLEGGVTSEGLQELSLESRRRLAIAKASAEWLSENADKIGQTMKELTPYFAERAKVALARSKKSIDYAAKLTSGLKSLELYTGDGVDVITFKEGASASTREPLTLIQGKRFMDEELAVHADVDATFDYNDKQDFFDEMAANAALRDQVMPFPRCVVTMAVTRRDRAYGESVSAYEAAMRNIENQSVFLLVRDGENLHVVYSSQPSHEAAERLFPTREELEAPFCGIDGTKIGLNDVAFSKATKKFDNAALHYKRFLVLLFGLDHRLKLMGEFYPPEETLRFMSLEFQSRFFRFYEDERTDNLLANELEPVEAWIDRCNANVQSGSRVMLTSSASRNSPGISRMYHARMDSSETSKAHKVTREGKSHYVSVHAIVEHGDDFDAKLWLDGPHGKDAKHDILCLDQVRQPVLHRYIHSRESRSTSIGWLRVFKRAERHILLELAAQEELRTYLRKTAVEYGGIDAAEVEEKIENSLMTWRCGHRGADAPRLSQTKAVQEILTLMYPAGLLAKSIDGMLDAFVEAQGFKPLLLNRTGKAKLVLYVEANEADKVPYATGCTWGWVKRVSIDALKTKLAVASTSLVWLRKDKATSAEEEVRRWPELDAWLQERDETAKLSHLAAFKSAMAEATELWGPRLMNGRAAPLPNTMGFEEQHAKRLFAEYGDALKHHNSYNSVKVFIPLGMVQESPITDVQYLYAKADAADAIRRYGSDEDFAMLINTFRRHSRYGADKQGKDAVTWKCVITKAPVPTTFSGNQPFSKPKFNTRKIKTDATRSERRYRYYAFEKEVVISWNRSVDVLMAMDPRAKISFNKSKAEDIKRERRFPDFDNSRDAAIAKIQERKFKPPFAQLDLSPLLWDAAKKRSVASNFFSISATREEN